MSAPTVAPITAAQGQEILAANFAPWVQALNLQVLACAFGIWQPRMVRSESSISPHMSDLEMVLRALAWLEP